MFSNSKLNNPERRACIALLCSPIVLQLSSCTSKPKAQELYVNKEKIEALIIHDREINLEEIQAYKLNPDNIKNLQDLIEEMKLSAGSKAPKEINLKEVYKVLATAFVDYAHDAIRLGIKLPESIAKRLPLQKKTVVPALMIFTLWGVKFILPISTFFKVVLGSLGVMYVFIAAAIDQKTKPTKSVA